jgi:hypothetical protein
VVARAAAENLTPTLLELGGQNPALVDETANITDAAKKIVWGATAWGGQWCTSPGYAYVHESVAAAFVAEAKRAVRELYGDDPQSNPDYSRIISAREVSRLVELIDPAKVVVGGKSDPQSRATRRLPLAACTWRDTQVRRQGTELEAVGCSVGCSRPRWRALTERASAEEGHRLVTAQTFPNLLGVHALVWVGDTSPASVDYAVAKTKETG